MSISVLTEPMPDGRFRAVSGSPMALEAFGVTRAAAKAHLVELIEGRIKLGAEVDELALEDKMPHVHPITQFAGDLQDNSLRELWLQAIMEYREEQNRNDRL